MPSQTPRDIFRLQILLKFLSSFPICKRASLCYGLSACLVGVLLCLFLFLTMCWLGRTVLSVYIDTSAQVGVRAEPSPPIGPSMVGFIPMHWMALAGVIWSKNMASDFWQLLFLKHSQWSWQPPVVSLSMRYVCFEAWWTFDNVVILHCSHLLGMNHYLSDSPIADLYCISCTEGLFLCLVGEPEFHVDDLDCLCTLISNHVNCIQHEHAASQSSQSTTKTTSNNVQLPHPISYYYDPAHALPYYLSPVGCYIQEVFWKRIIVMIVTNWAINIPSAPLIPSPQPTQGPSFGDWTDSRQCYLSVLDISSNCSSSWWWLPWCDICYVPSSALHICSSLCWQPFISPLS